MKMHVETGAGHRSTSWHITNLWNPLNLDRHLAFFSKILMERSALFDIFCSLFELSFSTRYNLNIVVIKTVF